MELKITIQDTLTEYLTYFESKFKEESSKIGKRTEYILLSNTSIDIEIEVSESSISMRCDELGIKNMHPFSKRKNLNIYNLLQLIRAAHYNICIKYIKNFSEYSEILELVLNNDLYLVGGSVSNPIFNSSIPLRDLDICFEGVKNKTEKILDKKFDHTLNRHGSKRYIMKDREKSVDFFSVQNVDIGYASVRNLLSNVDNSANAIGVSLIKKKSLGSWGGLKKSLKQEVTLNEKRWNLNRASGVELGIMLLRLIRLYKKHNLKITNKEAIKGKETYILEVEEEKIKYYTGFKTHKEAAKYLKEITT